MPTPRVRCRASAAPAPAKTLLIALSMALLALPPDAGAESILRRGVFGEPESLAPRESGVAGEQLILRDLFEGLATFSPSAEVVPGAAESWQVSADGLRYTFRLRSALRWSDGAPLTAADFVYGWQRALAPRSAAARAQRLYVIRGAREIHAGRAEPATLGARAADPRTLIVELEYPLPWLPMLFAGEEGFPLPRHAIERHGDQWTRAGRMVGNGAFMLAERRARGGILARRNPHFHGADTVRLDAVLFLPSDDTRALANRFRAGELEVNSWPGFPAAQQEALRRELGTQVRVTPLGSVRFLRFNLRRPPFDDLRIRRALSMLVDREVLVRRVLPHGERAAVRAMPEGLPLAQRPRALELEAGTQTARTAAARAALVEAGLRTRRTSPIRLRLPSGNGDEICIAVAAMWSAGGAPTQLEQSEIKSMIADLRRGDFDVALTGAQDSPAVESYLERFRRGSSYNTGGYASPAFESALDAALRLADPAARAPQLQRAESILAADHAIVPLIQEVARNLVAGRVAGWVDNPSDIHLSRYLSLR